MPPTTTNNRRPGRRASFTDFEQLLGLNGVAPLAANEIDEGAEAVLYLRVSTTRQMDTAVDIDEDGNSIATQREMCLKRCGRLKAPIAEEFVEPGNSAQSIAKRPQFRALLRYVEANPQVGYVVIYMRSRAFRNYTDAAIAKRILATMGVKLISAKEEFGDGYMADAMEAITDIMNEVQVRQSGEDISNKMLHKAQSGGTTGRAKLGYLNTRKDFDGRLVNTVDVDPVRAPLIRWAFEQYATGEYSLVRLRQAVDDQGLTTRKTAKWPEQPVSRTQLGMILRDPYYLGMVTFKGQVYPGRHEALVTPELFERVQRVMDTRVQRNQRDITHHHFLRAMLRCDRCHQQGRTRQLIFSQPVNKAGQAYQYYVCRGRQEHSCELPNLRIADVEDAVGREVASLRLSAEEAATMREQITGHLEQRLDLERETHARLSKELAKLDVKEERLLDLAADASLSTNKLRKRLNELRVRRAVLQRELDHTEDHVRKETDTMLVYVTLLERPGEFYAAATDEVKRKLLGAFYQAIWIDDDGHQTITTAEPREIVGQIRDMARQAGAEAVSRAAGLEEASSGPQAGSTGPSSAAPGHLPSAACSSKTALVVATDQQPNKAGKPKKTNDFSVVCSNKTIVAPNIDRRPNNYELLEPTLQQLKWLAAQSVEILAAVAPESPTRSEKPRRLRRRFSPEEVKEMAQQYRDGVSTPQLCVEHGISKTGILRLLHEEGVEVRRQTATDGVVAEAAQLYEAGMPVTRIAEQLSVSGSALRRSMLKAGVEMRPRGRCHVFRLSDETG